MNTQVTLLDLYPRMADLVGRGIPVAVAWVMETEGSTPREVGALALIEKDGRIHGSIGGGQVEAEAQRLAEKCLGDDRPFLFKFRLEGRDVTGADPICGGFMRVLIHPVLAAHFEVCTTAVSAQRQGQRGVLVITTQSDALSMPIIRFLLADRSSVELAGGEADLAGHALQREEACHRVSKPGARNASPTETLVLPMVPLPRLLIVGAGHIGQAVAAQALPLGFAVSVVDDRAEFARAGRFPLGVNIQCGDIPETLGSFPFDARTYVLLVSRGHRQDAEALAVCLRRTTAYLGMIGSRRKARLMREELVQSGQVTPERFDQVYAPVGLDIGAVTVPEIALSVVGQLVAVRRLGHAPRI